MEAPQVLPSRSVRLDTSDPDALREAQPERRRLYQRIARGRFRASLVEEGVGSAAILRERWSCGMRVLCDRPSGYRAFTLPLAPFGRATWCGSELLAGSLLRVDEPWEISTSGPFEYIAFAVRTAELEEVGHQLAGGEWRRRESGNLVLSPGRSGALVRSLSDLLAALRGTEFHPAASELVTADLLQLAAQLESHASGPVERVSPPSRRRAAVRRIEDYLEAHPGDLPSIPMLCGLAGVSQRTLEYAFREQVGMTPVRYLKVRRLNGVRRDLVSPEAGSDGVGAVAHRWGFLELGRFAGEYRSLFGELPSQTLARVRRDPRAVEGDDPTARR